MQQELNAPPAGMERLTRPQAIARIRASFAALADEENCACSVAARYGVLCGGFVDAADAHPHPSVVRGRLRRYGLDPAFHQLLHPHDFSFALRVNVRGR